MQESVGVGTPIVPHLRLGATVFSFQMTQWG
jgi:hypothetical protein